MIRKTVRVDLTEEYKEKAMNEINKAIDYVSNKTGHELNEHERQSITNRAMDQVNVNVTFRNKLKTLWVFDTKENIPIIVEKEKKVDAEEFPNTNQPYYQMKPNLTWTFNNKNKEKDGYSYEEFKEKVLDMLLEDFETASFYGTLSYITESDDYEERKY